MSWLVRGYIAAIFVLGLLAVAATLAISRLERAAQLQPDNLDTQLQLGRQYLIKSDFKKSIEHLRLAVGVGGGGGLGDLIFRGVAMVNTRLILEGAIPAALLAIAADVILTIVEKRLVRQ